MEAAQLAYSSPPITDAESEVAITVKHTITEGLSSGGVIPFRIPPDPERFTDLSSALLCVQYQILKKDGNPAAEDDKVFLSPGGIHSMFSSVNVSLNGEVASITNSYSQVAALCRLLGMSKDVREQVWDEVDGSWPASSVARSHVRGLTDVKFSAPMGQATGVKQIYGPIFSDILQSTRQLLPPGVSIGIDLRRAVDTFSLLTHKAQGTDTFKLDILSVSLYLRRLKLRPELHNQVVDRIRTSGAVLQYNRLEPRMITTKTSSLVRWLDCINGAPLPNRLYVALIDQRGYHGNIERIGTYFENFNITSFQAKLSGRDLLVEPMRLEFEKEADGDIDGNKSEAKTAFLALNEVIGGAEPLSPLRISWKNFILGGTIFALELGKCGEKSGGTGAIDLEFEFGTNNQDICIILFTEKSAHHKL